MPTVIDGTTGVSQVQPGVVSMADMAATGTPSATTLLRGDGSWQDIPVSATTANVLTATAAASVGAVGTYAFCGNMTASAILPDGTVAGSNLRYTNAYLGNLASPVPSGTWKCVGYAYAAASGIYSASLFLRIS